MSNTNKTKALCIDDLRHAEYYNMQKTFDGLYERSLKNEKFDELMDIILSTENILLAYRSIKSNTGSMTVGTDNKTIMDIGKLTPEEVVENVRYYTIGSPHGYRPKAVRRVDIPKPNGDTRPLGIPCIWDRLIQQCIKQIMEPICEGKFSDSSYGFRPDRSAEHAIAKTYLLMQRSHMNYVVEFDIKSFFDNVNHEKLIKQIWSIGIQDKTLIFIIKRMLKAPIKMQDGQLAYPTKGTPQGGIISPLLANIVLNELDQWIDSQWKENPIGSKYEKKREENGREWLDRGHGYRAMRNTNLKEMYIVRYADDFRIFCNNKATAEKILISTKKWLKERLKLEVSEEKTKITNTKKKYMEFLGFKIGLHEKSGKYVVASYISDKAMKRITDKLIEQAKNVANPRNGKTERDEIFQYNAMVIGIQNYYQIATNVNVNCAYLNRRVMTIFTNHLKNEKGTRLVKKGRELTDTEKKIYGKSQMLRYIVGSKEPIYPIGYIKHKNPMNRKTNSCRYTSNGRIELHDNLIINTKLMIELMKSPSYGRSSGFMDNRISLFSAQQGRCAVTGKPFQNINEIHTHHKKPRNNGGTDEYKNLTLVLEDVHKLIHATEAETINKYIKIIKPDKKQLEKLNKLRKMLGNEEIC